MRGHKMRRIIPILILLAFCCLGFSPNMQIIARLNSSGGEPNCASCNSGNDSEIVGPGNSFDSEYGQDMWIAVQFTIAITKCITGIAIAVGDNGDGRGATGEIYTDSTGEPGTRVGDGYTSTNANIPDSTTSIELLFAATQTLSAGTYWLVGKAASGAIYFGYQGIGGSGDFKYSTDAGENWGNASYDYELGGLGCDPT